MSCDQCREREAVIHLTQIVNDQVTTLHLCERCAAEKGVESPGSVAKTPLGTFLAAMGKEVEVPAPRSADTCSRCGASLQDFRESGRLGCPDCWRAFESPLRDLLRRLHGSTLHVGER
jgi:protein arginine kinase activator